MRPFTLQSVTFVLHQQPYADVLDQVGGLIAQYLGPRANLSLSDACRFQSTVLLDWIWASSCVSIASRPTHWSLDNYLRSDEFYNRWEFVESVKVAVTLDNVRTLQWLFRHFKGCVVLSDVVIMAAEKGSMPVLEFLLANDSTEGNKVQWGAASVQQALRCGHLDVAHWLYKHTPQTDTTEEQHEWTIKDAMDAGDIEFCQSLLPKGACILDYTRYCDIPEMIEWKLDCGYLKRDKKSAAVAIRDLAVTGHLDLIKRIASEHLNLPPQDRIESHRWGEALKEACKTDNLSVVKWLLEHPTGRQAVHTMKSTNSLSKLLSHSAEKGNVDVMQYLYEQGAVDKFGNALLDAIRTNQMEAVEWLLQHLPDSEPIPDFAVMHEAARRGHVGMLQYFQSLGSSGVPGFFSGNQDGEGREERATSMVVGDADGYRKMIGGGATIDKLGCQRTPWMMRLQMDSLRLFNGCMLTVRRGVRLLLWTALQRMDIWTL